MKQTTLFHLVSQYEPLILFSIVLNRLLFLINEGQVTDVEQEVISTNNNLLLHFSGHNNDLLVLKQWKGALNRIECIDASSYEWKRKPMKVDCTLSL